jgi:uncharacterized protein
MLLLNVKQLKAIPGRVIPLEGRAETKSIAYLGRELPTQAPLFLKARASYRKDGTVELTSVEARATVLDECSRCLKELSLPIIAEHERLEFEPEQAEKSYLEEDAFTYPAGADEIDLLPYLIGLIVSELEIKPLCKPDCKGLCAHCGHDLNQGPCACPQETDGDPRLEVLRKLLN